MSRDSPSKSCVECKILLPTSPSTLQTLNIFEMISMSLFVKFFQIKELMAIISKLSVSF